MEKELSEDHIGELNHSFADLVKSGEIVKAAPLPQERDEPKVLSKPRISFRNNRQSAGRLNEIILAINQMGSGS